MDIIDNNCAVPQAAKVIHGILGPAPIILGETCCDVTEWRMTSNNSRGTIRSAGFAEDGRRVYHILLWEKGTLRQTKIGTF